MVTSKRLRRTVVRFLCVYLAIGTLVALDWLAKGMEANARSISQFPPAECTTTQIKISEVEADPPKTGTDTTDEWFELYNTGSACTMTQWTITDNEETDTLPTLAIASGGHVVVAATTNFDTNHPSFSGARVFISDGGIGGNLSNTADFIRLRDKNDADVDCVAWGNPADNPCGFSTGATPQDNTIQTKQRTPTDGTDTDTAGDWKNADETPSGTPTVVQLASFTAHSSMDHVLLRWETVSESDIVGFNVLRSTVEEGPYIRLNETLIPSQAFGGLGEASYVYADQDVIAGVVYYYLLEVVNADGSKDTLGPIQVAVGSG